ncbi:MAG: HAMP domain-containing protein [Clostridiales bacterium]|nr:HAMP domain-containing protein [Clostridiales bacterium]
MKQKVFGKLHNGKIDGLTKRWLLNIICVVVVMLVVVFVVSVFSIKSYYYNSVENILNGGASVNAADFFSDSLASGSSLESSAAKFIDSYSYKDKSTAWVIDNDGNVIASSNGFIVENSAMPDYEDAMSGDSGTGKYIGKIYSSGDKIMAFTRAIKNSGGVKVGAVRVMCAVEKVDVQIAVIAVGIFLLLLCVFLIIILSNLFFIRSIIIPVREITETTKQISSGNLDVRIEKKYDDEIGYLCDSINSMAAEISTADKMKNDFLSTISHELRTPLTSIKGWAETLFYSRDTERDELTTKGLQVIVKEAGRLEGFVEELLDFSRLQSGRMTLRLVKTDIFAELDETVFTFRERAMREGIEVRYSIPDFAAPANADPNRLKQVFMNILDNALKYSRAPSKIFIKAEFAKFNGGDAVKISIADQGCGISKEDLPHVMDKFYKANVSVRGSGIGLAVTNEIVNLHKGKLEINSIEGKGTLVTIYLHAESAPSKQEIDMSMPKSDEVSDDDIKLERY